MAAEQVEHVVEEADPGFDDDLAAVEIDCDGDLGLLGLAVDFSAAGHVVLRS